MNYNYKFNYSVVAEGEHFIGRKSELNEIIKGINEGIKYSIYGQRRIGKTSIAFEIKRILENDTQQKIEMFGNDVEYKVVYCDCGTVVTEKDLWRKIMKELNMEVPLNKDDEVDIFELGNALLQNDFKKLIILDEFEIIAQNSKITSTVYNFLRGVSNTNLNINYLTISKKSIFDISELYDHLIGSPFFNIFTKYNLKGLTEDESRELLRRGLSNKTQVEEIIDELIVHSGKSPYYLNRIGDLCYKYEDIIDKFKGIKDEFNNACEPLYYDMLKGYDIERYAAVFDAIFNLGLMPQGILRRIFLEEYILVENDGKFECSSKSLENYIKKKI